MSWYSKQSSNKLEKLLAEVAQELYSREPQFRPLPPWILVRVLPKGQQYQSVILPDIAQNKTVYEGIVLATWAPYTEKRHSKDVPGYWYAIEHQCAVNIGDRILFPHHEGFPVTYLDDKYYRLVREGVDQRKYPYQGVYGTLDCREDTGMKEKLKALFTDVESKTISGFGRDTTPSGQADE